MITFLIKSTIITGLLWLVYRFVLQRESMFKFNRFYLLFCLCFALVIPFISFQAIPEITPFAGLVPFNEIGAHPLIFTAAPIAGNSFSKVIISGFLIYASVFLLLAARFIMNLVRITREIAGNDHVNYNHATLVLHNRHTLPHTFLQYIFLNKHDYAGGQIEQELFAHELAHARQKHSIDILFIELLQIVLWFNPFIYFIKRAIKLNHEFLADQAAIEANNDRTTYQYILLNKVCAINTAGLASSLHYSLTKKRFLMMAKKTSPARKLVLKLSMVPLIIVIALAFCTELAAQAPTVVKMQDNKKQPLSNKDSIKRIKDRYYGGTNVLFGRKNKEGKTVIKKYDQMTDEEKEEVVQAPLPPPVKKSPTESQLSAWLNPGKYGVWIDSKRIDNNDLKNYKPEDFGYYFVSPLTKTAKNYGKHYFQVNLMTVSDFEKWRNSELKRLGLVAD